MKLYNNTNNEVHYNVDLDGGGGDCGNINAGDTYDDANWDGQDLLVMFRALPFEPDGTSGPFSVTIPQTKPGMAVTIGLWHE